MGSEEWVYLLRVDQRYQVDMLRDILESRGIPIVVKSKGGGDYLQVYMGSSWAGFDLYVPTSRLEEARQWTDLPPIEPVEGEVDEENEAQEEQRKAVRSTIWSKKGIGLWLLLTAGLALLIWIIMVVRGGVKEPFW
ncbi:MAG TPA: DUF2007 domain-containing protein [Syntrophomonadaceae bacterium]|nr:DUF2007 domain-containing protein [Syntrophomonadaceae bacterium]